MTNKNILYNLLLLLVIVILIKHISPDLETTIYILKKYINYIIDIFKKFINKLFSANEINKTEPFSVLTPNDNSIGTTFNGIQNFEYKAPYFADSYEKYYIEEFEKKNLNINSEKIKNLYLFIDRLITLNVDNYFFTPSNPTPILFNNIEKNKLSEVLLKKLNSGNFVFSNFKFLKEPIYYNNFNGKDIQPFSFSVDCNQDIGTLNIYIEISIRNDIKVNTEYLVINTIKLLFSKYIANTNLMLSVLPNVNLNNLDYDKKNDFDNNTLELHKNCNFSSNIEPINYNIQSNIYGNYNFSGDSEPKNKINYLSNDNSNYHENLNYNTNLYSSVEFIK